MLGADVFVLELVRFFERILKDPVQCRTHVDLRLALNLGQFRDRVRQVLCQCLKVRAQLLQDRQNHAVLLLDQRPEQVFGLHLGLSFSCACAWAACNASWPFRVNLSNRIICLSVRAHPRL